MARDYAPRGGNNNRAQTRNRSNAKGRGAAKNSSNMPGWVWLVAGLSVGLAIAAFVYIQRPSGPMRTSLSNPPAELAATPKENAQPAARGKKDAIPLPPKEKERFTFYEILKGQEVVLPAEVTKAATPPPSVDTGTGSYIIQVASYRSQPDAEKQKASLALVGIESRIESVTIDNKDTFYRVRVGPERDWKRVQSIMTRLEENGIQAMLVKLK
jgi:cell division protein FtsN